MSRPPLLLVVGMHRSGTSLLGGLLQRLGVSLPGEKLPSDQHNPDGYYEWDEVMAIHERLLTDLNRWWPSPEGTLPLPEGWLDHPATKDARAKLHRLLRLEADRQSCVWAIKDPRCSRLLPLWIQLTSELSIPLRLLLAVRDPAEVTASLVHRDGPLTGMDANRAQQLWWRHNLEVVDSARHSELPLSVIDFGRWFDQPEFQLQQIVQSVSELVPSAPEFEQALALIQPAHRRSLGGIDSRALDPAVRRLHQRLLRQPMPKRMPNPNPPRRLVDGLTRPVQGNSLASQPEIWQEWMQEHRYYPAPRPEPLPQLAAQFCVELCGASWMELKPHFLMQRVAIAGLEQLQLNADASKPNQLLFTASPLADGSLDRLLINLELPPQERRLQWLAHLGAQPLVLDPDPARVLLLKACGLNVGWLDPASEANGWLAQTSASSPGCWARELGLVQPESGALVLLGSAGHCFDRALALEARSGSQSYPPIHYSPGWPELILTTPAAGLACAGWLQTAAHVGTRLIHASDQQLPELWSLLDGIQSLPFCLPPFSTPADLRALHSGQTLRVVTEDRPSPASQNLMEWNSGQVPCAAVVVSLYNYAERIGDALDSVAAQTCQQLELIVVDDASTDAGLEVVQSWMQTQLARVNHPFVRLLLLSHKHNGGLACARNTAFAAAVAPWCFVLDSDNALYPEAVEACLELASSADDELAVVHPLLAVEAETGRPDDQRSLVRPQSWQRSRFRFENMVDAMALVRRSAWQAAGGYTHMEVPGWEDYDFWCKLIDCGFYGLQCPRILAVYRSHEESMSHTATNHGWRALSRTLQDRHPWLELPLATP